MATPLNQADIAGVADAILGRLIDGAVGLNPTTPEALDVQNGIDTGEKTNGFESVVDKFTEMTEQISQLVAAKLAQVTVQAKQPAADTSPRVTVVPGNTPSVPNAAGSTATPPTPDMRPNAALEAAFASPPPAVPPPPADIRINPALDDLFNPKTEVVQPVVSVPKTESPTINIPKTESVATPEIFKPTPQPKIFAAAENQRENAGNKTLQAMAGIGAEKDTSLESKFDQLINAIRESVREKDNKPDKKEKDTPDKKESGEGMKALGDIAKTLLKTLIPISIAAAVLGSATSGMSTFLSAFKVLGAVVGTILLPAFVIGGALFLSLADIISANLLPNLEKWYEAIIGGGLQAINWLQKAVIEFVNEVLKLIPKIKEVSASLLELSASLLSLVAKILVQADTVEAITTGKNPNRAKPASDAAILMEAAAKLLKDDLKNNKFDPPVMVSIFEKLGIKLNEKGEPELPKFGEGDGIAGRMPANIRKMIAQFKFDNAPQAQSMGLVQAAQNAQLAALNQSPFERQMLEMMSKVIEALESVGSKLKPPTGE